MLANKVRSRYSVWTSAYASGARKCRKVGAANWGNSTERCDEVQEGETLCVEDSQIARSTGAGALTQMQQNNLERGRRSSEKEGSKVDVPKLKRRS